MFCFSRTPSIKPAGALLGISGLCGVHVCLTASLLIALFALLLEFQLCILSHIPCQKPSKTLCPQQKAVFKIWKQSRKGGKKPYFLNCFCFLRAGQGRHCMFTLPGMGLLQTVAVSHSNLLWSSCPSYIFLTRAIPTPQRCCLCCVASEWGAVKGTGRRLWVHT